MHLDPNVSCRTHYHFEQGIWIHIKSTLTGKIAMEMMELQYRPYETGP
jgi:hypothetical protein